MFCSECGAKISDDSKFCSRCGKPVAAPACPSCGSPAKPDAVFCPNCGTNLRGSGRPVSTASFSPPPLPPQSSSLVGIPSDLKEMAPGEVVMMDSGTFPISYVKNLMSSINGKLYLTNKRVIFRAGKFQGDAGMFGGDAATKSKQNISIPLSEITTVEPGMVTLIVHSGQNYKFGGMRKTKEWAAAILGAAGRRQ